MNYIGAGGSYRYDWFNLICFSFTMNNDVMIFSSSSVVSNHLKHIISKFEEISLAREVSDASMMLPTFFIGTYVVLSVIFSALYIFGFCLFFPP